MTQPYYQDGHVTIFHGDCREILPEIGNVDLVVTDPPYGIGEARGKNKSRSSRAKSTDYGVSSWDDSPVSADLLAAIIGSARYACVFGGNYYTLPPSPCWIVWDKVNGDNDFADCELAWTNYGTAVRMIRHQWHGMLRKGREPRIGHPTQKPLDVMSFCIQKAPIGASLVLDPFMGSGTTLRAAKDLGRKAIGIEIEEKYCEIAANRMRQEVLF